MQCGSAFTITKLLRELTTGDIAIKAAEHETKTRGESGESKTDFSAFKYQLWEIWHLNVVQTVYNMKLQHI